MRVFAMYSDFVVREMGDAKSFTVGEIGRFTIGPSFQVLKFGDKSQNQRYVGHHLMNINVFGGESLPDGGKKYGPILLKETFELSGISERPANEKAGFVTEITFKLRDSFGTTKEFYFDRNILTTINHLDFQRYLFEIKDSIDRFQSFREIELTKEIQSKDVELEKLKNQLKETDIKY